MTGFTLTLQTKLTVDQILDDCTEIGVRVDLQPLADYPNSLFQNPKVLRHMQIVAKATTSAGRCHPRFSRNQNNHRISSRDPNLLALSQNARAMIVPDDGHVMFEAFFRLAELRALQVLSQDQDYLAMLEQPDPHQYMADKLGVSRQYAKMTAYRAPYWEMFKKVDFLYPTPPVNEYLACFPKLKGWLDSMTPQEAARYVQRFAASALDAVMPDVEFNLRGTGARILFPHVDGLILTVPKELEEAVKEQVTANMMPNFLNAPVLVDVGANLQVV